MCRRPSGTDCREQVSIKSGRPVAKKVGSAREAANSPRASVFVYNLSYGVLADEAGRFPVTGNYSTTDHLQATSQPRQKDKNPPSAGFLLSAVACAVCLFAADVALQLADQLFLLLDDILDQVTDRQ